MAPVISRTSLRRSASAWRPLRSKDSTERPNPHFSVRHQTADIITEGVVGVEAEGGQGIAFRVGDARPGAINPVGGRSAVLSNEPFDGSDFYPKGSPPNFISLQAKARNGSGPIRPRDFTPPPECRKRQI